MVMDFQRKKKKTNPATPPWKEKDCWKITSWQDNTFTLGMCVGHMIYVYAIYGMKSAHNENNAMDKNVNVTVKMKRFSCARHLSANFSSQLCTRTCTLSWFAMVNIEIFASCSFLKFGGFALVSLSFLFKQNGNCCFCRCLFCYENEYNRSKYDSLLMLFYVDFSYYNWNFYKTDSISSLFRS